ncbi:MAG: ABC transporter permease [Acidobacteriia bacterium]|nr:ABC transporter permease [Terriglobia bacterium]
MREFFRRIYYLLNRNKLERELQHDIAAHREMLGAENRNAFGNPTLLAEQSRDAWGWSWLDRLFQDLRFGARLLRKSPGLAFTAITVLALGIGVNVTAFNIVDVMFFKPLPVRDPQSIMRLTTRFLQGSSTEVAYPAAVFYGEHSTALSAMVAQSSSNMTFAQTTSQNIHAGLVTGNYFTELGAAASYGRLFDPKSDEAPDAPPVVVLGYRFWQGQFGGDPSVIGRTIRLNQHPATVIGVTSFDFVGLDPEHGEMDAVWLLLDKIPYFVPESKMLTSFDANNSGVHMWGRVKPGISFKAAEASLQPLAEELVRQHPSDLQEGERLVAAPGGYAVHLDPADAGMLPIFGIFAALVLLVLAAACGNLGNLVLSRVMAREREIFIRLSLGAGRGRILRQLMTESLLLALLGAAAGLFLSWLVSRPLVIWLGGPGVLPLAPDWRTTLFALGVGVLACVLFGLPSARQALRSSQRPSRVRTIFMTSQFAASCVLLIVAGLLLRALHRAVTVDPGFDYTHTLTINPHLDAHAYTQERAGAYFYDMRARLAQVPGVQAVALVNNPPLGNRQTSGTVRGPVTFRVYMYEITPGYFASLSIPLLAGRSFQESDQDVAIVSQSYAQKRWPGKDPLRQECEYAGKKMPVIGVARNARTLALRDSNAAEAYFPLRSNSLGYSVLVVRTSSPPEQMSGVLADLARSADPLLSPDVVPLTAAFREKLGDTQKMAGIISFMGALALVLAVVGLYGVVSYNVIQRTREIGIRVALGATPASLIGALLAGWMRPLGLAAALGALLAAGLSLVLRSELYGVSNLDPLSYLGALVLLAVTGGLAALIPARRALKVDPMVALRCE